MCGKGRYLLYLPIKWFSVVHKIKLCKFRECIISTAKCPNCFGIFKVCFMKVDIVPGLNCPWFNSRRHTVCVFLNFSVTFSFS